MLIPSLKKKVGEENSRDDESVGVWFKYGEDGCS